MQTRRKFLKDASMSVLIAGMTPLAGIAGTTALTDGPARLDHRTFSKLVKTRFRALHEGAPAAELLLIKTEVHPAAGGGECFSLLFHGLGKEALEQGTYRFAHVTLGEFQMFVVPRPCNGQGRYVEAIFNRLS